MVLADRLSDIEGLLEEGRSARSEVPAIEPEDPRASIALGQSARRSGDRAAALAHFQAAAAQLPQDVWRKLDVVEELMALGRLAEAAALCREILAIEPENPQAFLALGQSARRSGDRAAALAYFHLAAAQLPRDVWRKLDVVEELMALGRLDGSVAVCQEILAIAPDNPQAFLALGQCARRRGDRAASLEHFRSAAAQLPQDVWRKLDVVEDLLSMERFDEAEAVCHEILAVEPDNPRALIIVAQNARRGGKSPVN